MVGASAGGTIAEPLRQLESTATHAILLAMAEIAGSEEFFAMLRSLIDAWCDRRCLRALNRILPAYLGFNGLTDSWNELFDALRNLRAFANDELTEPERENVSRLLTAAGKAIYRGAGQPDRTH
jgi:hypothetical protein